MSRQPPEVYRDKRGRFTRRSALVNGPWLPLDKLLVLLHKRLLDEYCKPNPMLERLKR